MTILVGVLLLIPDIPEPAIIAPALAELIISNPLMVILLALIYIDLVPVERFIIASVALLPPLGEVLAFGPNMVNALLIFNVLCYQKYNACLI
jgi:hypothetical protein